MSLKFRNAAGVETPIAGLNGLSGELVPSVSYYQSGSKTSDTTSWSTGETGTFSINLSENMPDTDYIVVPTLSVVGVSAIVHAKTVNSFKVTVRNDRAETIAASITLYWQAFKLMTDESRALDEQAIAVNTSDIAALQNYKYTLLTSSDNIDSVITPGNYGGYSGDSIGGTFPYSGNGQFAITVIKAKAYVYQICRMGFNSWQRYANASGTTVDWSDWSRFALDTDIDAIEAALENYARTDVISITTEAELVAFRTSKDITQPFYNAQQVAIDSNGLYLPPYFRGVLVSNSSALVLWGAVGNGKYMYYHGSNGWQGGKILLDSDLTATVASGSAAPITSGGVASYITTGVASDTNKNTFTFNLPTLADGEAWEITVTAQTWNSTTGFVSKYIASRSGTAYRLSNCGGVTTGHTATISTTQITFTWNNADNTIAYWRARYTKLV